MTRKVYGEDEVAIHRYDYDWLLDFVIKVSQPHPSVTLYGTSSVDSLLAQGNHVQVQNLVKNCSLFINCQSRDVGNRYVASYLIGMGLMEATPAIRSYEYVP